MFFPSASQRKRFETGSGQQSTEWPQRVDWKTIDPSGSQHGSMSLHGMSKSAVCPATSSFFTIPLKVSCRSARVSRFSVQRW
ncbi:MAG: hypothetical protein BWX70_03055 [Verrucomicrobia bacterium ADurb.Bin070]|nr:MAG: hypothetical protein BWX70_03055 [Verrucomicrobia bacterium ADurb.Bin070]